MFLLGIVDSKWTYVEVRLIHFVTAAILAMLILVGQARSSKFGPKEPKFMGKIVQQKIEGL